MRLTGLVIPEIVLSNENFSNVASEKTNLICIASFRKERSVVFIFLFPANKYLSLVMKLEYILL